MTKRIKLHDAKIQETQESFWSHRQIPESRRVCFILLSARSLCCCYVKQISVTLCPSWPFVTFVWK